MRDLLQDSVEKLFADRVTPEALRLAETGQWPTDLWNDIEALGLPLAKVSEAHGGSGATWSEVMAVARACGQSASPVPLSETLLANALLSEAGIQPPQAGAIVFAAGSASAVLPRVPWGRHACWLVLLDAEQDRIELHSLKSATVASGLNAADEPRDDVQLAPDSLQASAPSPLEIDAINLGGAMLRTAQIAGALSRVTEMTTAYANERSQFGRPIGKFQAVQQQLAVLATLAAAANAAAEQAFLTAESGFDLLAIASAKTVASEAAAKGASIAHAVHGAIGFTHEHSLHFFTRRLWAWREDYGTDAFWAGRIGKVVAAGGAASLWPAITAVLETEVTA